MDDIKNGLIFAILGISLFLTVWFWSTIQLIFLLSIGPIFTLWGLNLRQERKSNAFVASVIGVVLSLVILLNYTPILLSQMGHEYAPAAEVIEEREEEQGILDKIFKGKSEPDGPDEPSLLDQYLLLVILFNAGSIFLGIRTFVTQEKANRRIAGDVGDDNTNANPSFGTTQTPGQQNDKSNFNNFLTTINRWLSDKDS